MKTLYPVNKNIKSKITPLIYKNIDTCIGISIITCTNKENKCDNILNNFIRQNHQNKELIIILNNNNLKIDKWKYKLCKFNNINIYQLDQKITLGECINFAINKSNYPIIAKFDDDDYYGPEYLSDSLKILKYTEASIVGKSSTYVYFEKDKLLALKNNNRDNRYVFRVEGATLMFKKEIFDYIKFKSKNLGEDLEFCKSATREGLKIFSSNIHHYLYIRNINNNHSWNVSNAYLLKNCKIICKGKDLKYILENYINVTSPK